jgi:protein-disulfide isomerase
VSDYNGKVRVVYMNLVVHPAQVQMAHKYGCAAAKQGKFLAWKKAWWEKAYANREFSTENILKFSADLGLDTTKLKADAEATECDQRIESDRKELEKFHVNGTPGFFINGRFHGGGMPKSDFKTLIDEQLKIAETSGVPGGEYYQREVFGKGLKQFRSRKDAKASKH